MRKRIEWEWEVLNDHPASATKRAKVIGGWLVVHQTYYDLGSQKARLSESMSFVPDREHFWEIKPPMQETPAVQAKALANEFTAN